MVNRSFWLQEIEKAWDRKPLIWLSGVRRVGKTYLCKSIPNVEHFDLEISSTRQIVADYESFFSKVRKKKIILDEIHKLQNPSEVLKVAHDHYPDIKIIATGSSTLSASKKFKDTLTGRKALIWLTPMILNDLHDFNNDLLEHRFLLGGLPPFFLCDSLPEHDFEEWMDDYWAKDIQELFNLERKDSFQKFVELLFMNSGGIFEATKFATPSEVSRGTITNYLRVLESTYVAHIIKPFSSHKPTEIVSAPKVYAFDTGFVCYFKGWSKLRREDMGVLWEHFVLNEIFARLQSRKVLYWRDKQGHEIDFILAKRGQNPIVIECKWKSNAFDSSSLQVFRRLYPKGKNYVVANDVTKTFSKRFGEIEVDFVNLESLIKAIV